MIKTVTAPIRFVRRHKTGIAILATAAICLTIQARTANEHNKFLKEHDLFDEFYAMNEDI